MDWIRRAKNLQKRLARLCRYSNEEWVRSEDRSGWTWELVDPAPLTEELLFRGARKVILVSATVRRKTLALLGLDGMKIKLSEQESSFPVARRPVYYWPVASVNRKMSEADKQRWLLAVDEFMAPRLDRNGVVQAVSYARAEEIVKCSRLRERASFMLHRPGQSTEDVVAAFKREGLRRPTILVSPAVRTGVDFPLKQTEWQVIAKVPFPDLGSPLVRVRTERDSSYPAYMAMQDLVHSVGRGMRTAEDRCESLVPDSNLGRLRGRYHDFAPRWFWAAVRTIPKDGRPPSPSPPL